MLSPPLRHRQLVETSLLLLLLRPLSPPSPRLSLHSATAVKASIKASHTHTRINVCVVGWNSKGDSHNSTAADTHILFLLLLFLNKRTQLGGLATPHLGCLLPLDVAWISSSDLHDGKRAQLLILASERTFHRLGNTPAAAEGPFSVRGGCVFVLTCRALTRVWAGV